MQRQAGVPARESIIERFEGLAARRPHSIAAVSESAQLTYSQLDTAANVIARTILEGASAPDLPICLLLPHDLLSIVAFVGLLKSGRPQVSLDPAAPPGRLRRMLEDAGSLVLVCAAPYEQLARGLASARPGGHALSLEELDLSGFASSPGIHPSPDAPMAIFYTSGTTGEPRGLVHTHGLASRYSAGPNAAYAVEPTDRIAMLRPLRTPPHAGWLLGGLQAGATICVFDFAGRGPARAAAWIRAKEITILPGTPSMMRPIFESLGEGEILPSIRYIRVGGEPVRVSDLELLKAHTARGCVFENALGSTDAVMVARARFDHDSVVGGEMLPIGEPVPGVEVSLLGGDGRPVADGEAGELVIRSAHLAAGYWNDPALTAERFRPDPAEPGVFRFLTGDRARRRPDGMLEFVGRTDSMVKIRGQRVELLEVEAAVRTHPAVNDVAVLARPSRLRPDQLELIGYAVVRPGHRLTAPELRRRLARDLPAYMLPAHFVFLDSLPIGANGKIDLRALPEVQPRPELAASDAPTDDLQVAIVEIWQAGLKTAPVGVGDNYFELGGDSLSVLSMMLEVEKAVGKPVPPEFFREPTIRALAQLLRAPASGPVPEPSGFRLQAHRQRGAKGAVPLPGRMGRAVARARRGLRHFRRTHDRGYYFEWLLAQVAPARSFDEMAGRVHRLAGSRWLAGLVYGARRKLFERFSHSMGAVVANDPAVFAANLAANLLMKVDQGRPPFQHLQRSTLAGEGAIEALDRHFPVSGLEHLRSAHACGRGVILVSVHGTALHQGALLALSRRLGVEEIPTIAQRMPLEQSAYWGTGAADRLPAPVGSALRAELAFYAQDLLRRGRMIHVSPDVIAIEGPTHKIRVGDRTYDISGGIAELALNTGAPVIPAFGRFVGSTRLLVELLPPLQAGTGTRLQQVRSLLDGYGDFATEVFRRHPEAISWKKMRNHLKWPRWAAPSSVRDA